MDVEDYLREILKRQERTNKLLEYVLMLSGVVAFALIGAKAGWWAFAVSVAS